MIRYAWLRAGLMLAGVVIIGALFVACEGASSQGGMAGPRPRSREAAGEFEELPYEADLSNRKAIDSDGGEVEYRQCRVSIPRGAVSEPIFVEIAVPDAPPADVMEESAYQVNPDGLELMKDGLITIGYFDDTVPAGKNEEDLVIVHSVNGVWVELSDTKVHIYNNTVEAPIRYLGLYAVRIADYDPRRLNTLPVASFQFSTEPFPETVGKSLADAQAEMGIPGQEPVVAPEDIVTEPGKLNVNTATIDQLALVPGLNETLALRIYEYRIQQGEIKSITELRNIEGIGVTASKKLAEYLTPGVTATEGDDAASAEGAPAAGAPPADSRSDAGGSIRERRFVAGPEEAETGDTGSAGNVAEGAAPAPSIAGDEQPVIPETPDVKIYFDGSTSYDPDGKIVQYAWDFDSDGIFDYTSHASPYAEHIFRHSGDYTVVLKVTDNGRYAQSGFGTSLVTIRSATAEPVPLSANIACFPAFGPSPLTVRFGSTTIGGNPPYAYTWTFADGSESSLANPFTTYPEPGQRTVRFQVTDVTGAKLTGSLGVESCVADMPATPQPRMELDISPSAERGYGPLTAKFQIETKRATAPVTYRVSFGDEGPDEQETVISDTFITHKYENTGFYLVKVIATDADLRTTSTFATVFVMSPDIERDFTASAGGYGGDPFSFGHGMQIGIDYTNASQRTVRFNAVDPPREADYLGFQWDFGDGTYSTEPAPEHTYAGDGVYEVHLTASDGLERWRHRIWLPVSATEPAVAIQRPAYIEGPAPLRLDFEALVTRGEQPFRYDWIIGEVHRSDPSAFYTFQTAGDYEVHLDVEDKWNKKIHAPVIKIKVRPGPVSYRQPLALIEPVSGSTRAVVVDFNGSNPLPLSSPHVEGSVRLVDLSNDGARLAIVGEEALLVKRVGNGEPVVAMLPAAGEIVAVRALDVDAAYCTVDTAGGAETYLLRPEHPPLLVSGGALASVSADGGVVILGPEPAYAQKRVSLIKADAAAGQIGDPVELPGVLVGATGVVEAALSADGRTLYYIDDDMRVVKRALADGSEDFLSTGEDPKSGLTVSADGSVLAFVSKRGDERDVIYGRTSAAGEFRLVSVTDTTGFFSEYLRLSADGSQLLGYGSRTVLAALLDGAQATAADDEAPAGGKTAEGGVPDLAELTEADLYLPSPISRRERFGVIRLTLGRSPDTWNINTVDARFIMEASAVFDVAGPFQR